MECDIELGPTPSKRLKHSVNITDYNKCIICQNDTSDCLYRIQSTTQVKLSTAMEARSDDVAVRLKEEDVTSEQWLINVPKWHNKCRNFYINEKSYLLVKRKRLQTYTLPSTSTESTTSMDQPMGTRSKTPTFDAKTTCVICSKHWCRHKEPTCKVSTESSQKGIYDQAVRLGRQDILHRLVGHGSDMVANDICYHLYCMNKFRATRVKTGKPQYELFDEAFSKLVGEIEAALFEQSKGFLIKTLRDRFRIMLHDLGVENAEGYRSASLKERLIQHYGERVCIMDHSYEAGFICASNVPIGDALKNLTQLRRDSFRDPNDVILQKAAKIIRTDAKLCKTEHQSDSTLEISISSAAKIVPDSVFNFNASLCCDKTPPKVTEGESVRVDVDQRIREKALLMSQQMLQQVAGVNTPLGVSTAYHIYNQTRSKSLVTLNNKLGVGISYDSLQRQLTSQSLAIMRQIEEDGTYVPQNMSRNRTHVFAMDNLDWKKKTLEGGSFNATTAIIIESCDDRDLGSTQSTVNLVSSSNRQRTLPSMIEPTLQQCHVTAADRRKSRSLNDITSIDCLQTPDDGSADNLLLVWRLCRIAPDYSHLMDVNIDEAFPGFPSFCAQLFPKRPTSKLAYLPLIPSSPTNPAVLKEEMTRLVKLSRALGDTWTVITGDQATYELAATVREKNIYQFNNVILLLGGFHLAHNYLMAICKIMRESGAESVLTTSGLCLKGTAEKMFGHKADYYQTIHAVTILYEAVWHLLWEEFENWIIEKCQAEEDWVEELPKMVELLSDRSRSGEEKLKLIDENQAQLTSLQEQIKSFYETLQDRPTALFWINFLEMTNIIQRFIFHEREGNWLGYLAEAAKMLPYLTAAGHYKYGQQSLPLYLHEMKHLPDTAPGVHQAFMQGAFVGRRAEGHHNGVSPDMLLEQTYNKSAKETSGLDGITTNPAARSKWVYTKSTTAAVSSQLKSMSHLDPETEDPHHEGGRARVERDCDEVLNVVAAIEVNPFGKHPNLINIVTGQKADTVVQQQLLSVKQIGIDFLSESIKTNQKKTRTVKLQTFATQNKATKSRKVTSQSGKSDECVALLRMLQISASGEKVDIINYIGNHECSKVPTSMFTDDGQMRSGNKATLVSAIKIETGVSSVPKLPESQLKTTVIVDAMSAIRHWSFHKDETFGQVSWRFKHNLLSDIPSNTESIHFCCDRYKTPSLKGNERQKRSVRKATEPKVYDIQERVRAPEPLEFFSVSANKAGLQQFLCDTWVEERSETSSVKNVELYLGGGFSEETKYVRISKDSVTPVPELESTQEEADTRMVLHAVYSTKHDHVERLVIHANDTDVIVLFIYYASSMLKEVPEIWVRTDRDTYLPIHDIATALGQSRCRSLPFIHSLSGRDTTSSLYFKSKKTWLSTSKAIKLSAMEEFAETDGTSELGEDLAAEARRLLLGVYAKSTDANQSLAEVRAHKFLNNNSTLLKLLPPTADAFDLHVKRAALTTIIDKSSHIAKPDLPPVEEFGWVVKDDRVFPVATSGPLWPQEMARTIACSCVKGCGNRCSCVKKDVPCYIGCKCTGSQDKCSHARLLAQLSDLYNDRNEDSNDEYEL